jgi:sec-independent protein translocase protein TatA
MAFEDPMQWVIIGVVVLVIFLWGPQKIPDLARSLGRAKKEFDQAQKEFTAVSNPVGTMLSAPLSGGMVSATQKPAEVVTGDQTLVDTAKQLGIATEGKTREQISQEIVGKLKPQN